MEYHRRTFIAAASVVAIVTCASLVYLQHAGTWSSIYSNLGWSSTFYSDDPEDNEKEEDIPKGSPRVCQSPAERTADIVESELPRTEIDNEDNDDDGSLDSHLEIDQFASNITFIRHVNDNDMGCDKGFQASISLDIDEEDELNGLVEVTGGTILQEVFIGHEAEEMDGEERPIDESLVITWQKEEPETMQDYERGDGSNELPQGGVYAEKITDIATMPHNTVSSEVNGDQAVNNNINEHLANLKADYPIDEESAWEYESDSCDQ
eukprot:GHVH01001336.1.p1 GENE.GHVH01001336.1~~GHVH01001336.1.p1  ORF type:complete len:265 (-),score=51.74 GHVH01001336.1:20-814(-)